MRFLVIGLVLAVGACATSMPAGTTYDPASGDALVVVDQTIAGRGNSLILEGVDLETQTFTGPRRLISLAARNRLEGGSRGLSLYLGAIPPGVYAVAGQETVTLAGRNTVCYGRGAIVIDLLEGQANVVSRNVLRIANSEPQSDDSGEPPVLDIAVQSARQVLAASEAVPDGITIERAETLAQIRWERETTVAGILVGENCPEARNFDVIQPARPSPGNTIKPGSSPGASSD